VGFGMARGVCYVLVWSSSVGNRNLNVVLRRGNLRPWDDLMRLSVII